LKRLLLIATAAALVALAACTSAPPPAPTVAPQGDERYLVDPRTGYSAPDNPKLDRRFDELWRTIQAGQGASVRGELANLRVKNPNYLPLQLAEAAIAMQEKDYAAARTAIERVQQQQNYLAAEIYEAEAAVRTGDVRRGFDFYSHLTGDLPDVTKERVAELRQRYFNELVASGQLQQALVIDPGARDVRMTLVQRLLSQRNWDEARSVLEPLVNSEADRADVQEALAEIEVGRGQFEQAIVRYERLARREHDPRYARRLDEIKQQWTARNMPPQYLRAAESEVITRGDLAVLLYWKVASIRFAQNVGTPPIAVDLGEVTGREEIIRAIALGILQVDPVTRRVGPSAPVTASALTRYAARVLSLRGAACARGAGDPSRILSACSVTDPSATLPPDSPISGRAAESVIDEIDRVLGQ